MDPPPDLQFQLGITVPRHLEDGGAAGKRQGSRRDGGGLEAQ